MSSALCSQVLEMCPHNNLTDSSQISSNKPHKANRGEFISTEANCLEVKSESHTLDIAFHAAVDKVTNIGKL